MSKKFNFKKLLKGLGIFLLVAIIALAAAPFLFKDKILPISGIACFVISFIIIINSKEKGGPNAIYCISRSDVSKSGTIRELVKSHGVNDDELELTWNPYEYPLLQIRTKLYLYNKNNRIDFTVNVITSF